MEDLTQDGNDFLCIFSHFYYQSAVNIKRSLKFCGFHEPLVASLGC